MGPWGGCAHNRKEEFILRPEIISITRHTYPAGKSQPLPILLHSKPPVMSCPPPLSHILIICIYSSPWSQGSGRETRERRGEERRQRDCQLFTVCLFLMAVLWPPMKKKSMACCFPLMRDHPSLPSYLKRFESGRSLPLSPLLCTACCLPGCGLQLQKRLEAQRVSGTKLCILNKTKQT